MIDQDDWRLVAGPISGSEEKYKNIPLYYIPFQPLSESWDHEHCLFCWDKFYLHPECLREGYCTRPQNQRDADWICPACYEDFKEMFGWTIKQSEVIQMVNDFLLKYEGKELELFRNYGNPYETISIRIQIDGGCMYLGDEEMEHGPDYGRSLGIYTFDQDNTRKAFELLSREGEDPVLALKAMLNEQNRTRPFIALCDENNIAYQYAFYL